MLSSKAAFENARVVLKRLRAVQKNLDAIAVRRLRKLEARIALAQGGEGPELAASLEETLKSDPLDGDALMLLAQYYQRRNDSERAGLYYERAEGIADFEVTARTRHAQLLVGLGRYSEALPLLRRAQEIKPREDVARYLEQVERIARVRK